MLFPAVGVVLLSDGRILVFTGASRAFSKVVKEVWRYLPGSSRRGGDADNIITPLMPHRTHGHYETGSRHLHTTPYSLDLNNWQRRLQEHGKS